MEMIDWASDISIDVPKKRNINPNVPTTRQIIEFKDKFMKETAQFTGYDASEGALYVLFMLCLAMHPKCPTIFAVDSFDHALNPRLAKKMIQVFCQQIIENDKYVFLTTHNPLVLDGLDISNDDIRLFSVERDKNGYAQIKRIKVSQELINEGQPLSRLWIMLKGIVDKITNESNYYIMLQPEPDLTGRYGNGWKGVWKWCADNAAIKNKIMKNIEPELDFLIIQMDGDVSRKEKAAHCW